MFEPNKKIHLVGSSGNLLESKSFELIDSADYVIRFNRAPVKGFEEHVGYKTTHRYVNRPAAQNQFEPYQERDLNFFKRLYNEIIILDDPQWDYSPVMNDNKFYKVFSESCSYVYLNRGKEVKIFYENFKSNFDQNDIPPPTTRSSVGFAMICYCLNRGLNISLFGFGVNENPKTSSHYYGNKPSNARVGHDYSFERKVIKLLAQ